MIYLKQLLVAFGVSFFIAIIYNADKKLFILCGFSGFFGYLFYILGMIFINSVLFASFLGACVVALYSEICARIIKTPATIFSIAGIIPLVPGVYAYNAILYFVDKKYRISLQNIVQTIIITTAICFGYMMIAAFFSIIRKRKERKNG